jgi:mycothiol synthase
MNARLPEGYAARPVVLGDVHQIAELVNAQSRWLNGVDQWMEDELVSQWGWDFFHLETDTLAVFTADQRAVGYVEMWDIRAPHVSLIGYVLVHPEHMQRGIGSFLAGWLEERARRNVSKAPADARVSLHQSVQSTHQSAIDLLSRRGYCHTRDSYRMRIDFDRPLVEPVLPEGIVIRGIIGEEEERQGLFARYESFLDHRGAIEEPFEAYYKRWKKLIDSDPYNDPTLWFLAWDGDQPAGVVFGCKETDDDPEMGWIHTVGVRRAWRRRGVGQALLQRMFCELYAREKKRAGLGVDAASLTGATRLYERAGMRVERVLHSFEFELREGKILSRQSIG